MHFSRTNKCPLDVINYSLYLKLAKFPEEVFSTSLVAGGGFSPSSPYLFETGERDNGTGLSQLGMCLLSCGKLNQSVRLPTATSKLVNIFHLLFSFFSLLPFSYRCFCFVNGSSLLLTD